MFSNSRVVVASTALALAMLSCSGASTPPSTQGTTPSALSVTSIDVGRSIAADKTIADKTQSFAPTDIFYVAVNTVGSSPSARLVARWTYGDQLVTEATQTIAPSGPAVTEFHVSKPAGDAGWPKGDYKVEITLNGTSTGTKSFKVQ